MARLLLPAAVLAVGWHLPGCSFPEFEFQQGSGGAATQTGSVGGGGTGGTAAGTAGSTATGTGGTGGVPTGTGTGTGDVGGTGGTGGDPGPCGGCQSGLKCTIVDEADGTWGCADAGPRPAWTVCFNDGDCQAGLWCDQPSEICKPICDNVNQCNPSAQCVPAETAAGNAIPNLKLCTSFCHPENVQPCDSSQGAVNCVYRDQLGAFDCWRSAGHQVEAGCTQDADCGATMACASTQCLKWCDNPGNAFCNTGIPLVAGYCSHLEPEVLRAGEEFGVCVPAY